MHLYLFVRENSYSLILITLGIDILLMWFKKSIRIEILSLYVSHSRIQQLVINLSHFVIVEQFNVLFIFFNNRKGSLRVKSGHATWLSLSHSLFFGRGLLL